MDGINLPQSNSSHPLAAYSEPGATVVNKALAAGVAESITVPAGARVMRLWSSQDLIYNFDVTATAITDSTTHFGLAGGLEREIHLSPTPAAVSVYSASVSSVSAAFWS